MSQDISSLRTDYSTKELNPDDCLADPLAQFSLWLEQALSAQIPEPTAMHLATVDAQGRPSARMVLLKGVEQQQFIFYSNYLSRKGEQLSHNPYVALTFFWPELERQVRVEGRAEKATAQISDDYFASRPYSSRIGAWASQQSQPLPDKMQLLKNAAEYTLKFITKVPRPEHWGGYTVTPNRLEFWQGRPSRLHDRVLYLLNEKGEWTRSRLYP